MKKIALGFVAGCLCLLTACDGDNSVSTLTTKLEEENAAPSSSTMAPVIVKSPGMPVSSSSVEPGNELGTCQPIKNPINKGESTQWKFTANPNSEYPAREFARADYDWSFEEGAVAGGGTLSTSDAVTYVKSGLVHASLRLTICGDVKEISCSPLQVNGDPISCTCTATGGDIANDDGVARWIASCFSVSSITSYIWDGNDLGAETMTYSHSFSTKGDAFTPTLTVKNADNTVENVTCPTVEATDASDPD